MATSPLGGFADISQYAQAAAQPVVSPLDALIQGFGQGQQIANLPQTMANKALNDQLALAINQAKLRELQQPQTFNTSRGLFVADPTAPGGFRVVSGSAPVAATVKPSIHYETREDGTYAISSNDPFNAVKINIAGTGTNLSGKPTKTSETKWHYETREDGTYAIPSTDPTKAVRVTLANGVPDPQGAAIVNESATVEGPAPGPTPMPGKPRAGGKSAKLSEDEKKMLLAGISQSKILPAMVDEFKELKKTGLAGPVAGQYQSLKAAVGFGNKDFTKARSNVKGNLFKLARALQGGGVLTEPDIERMENIAPDLNVQEDQFIGGMQGVAGLMRDNLQSFVDLNGGRLDSEALSAVNKGISDLEQFINLGTASAPTGGTQGAGTKIGRFILIPE